MKKQSLKQLILVACLITVTCVALAYTQQTPPGNTGHTTNPEIRSTDSITDYVFTWLGLRFSEDFRNERSAISNGGSL